jgi:anti-sigma regulatory factor (Ser/Thr protein kinase)
MTSSANHRRGGRLDHYALIVDDDDTIGRVLVPQLRRRIAANEDVLMVVGAQTIDVVRERLGPDADTLMWAPADRFYQRLGFTYARFLRYLRDQHSQQRVVHLITEPDLVTVPESPVDRAAAYLGYEAVANGIFSSYGCPITCIWHCDQRTTAMIEEVRRVHPREWTAQGAVDNPEFAGLGENPVPPAQPPMTPAPAVTDIDVTVVSAHELAACRAAVARWAELNHFLPDAIRQVVAAVSEVVANGVRHGRPPVRLRGWNEDATLIVHVDDHGGVPIPAEAGYRPPTTPVHSAGLWIARQLADVLLTRSEKGLTSVRMYFPYAVTHRDLDIPYLN